MRKRTPMGCIVLAVYVDDIILTGIDEAEIVATNAYLRPHFVSCDLSPPPYFFGLEIAYCPDHIVLCQNKYALDLLEETGMLECKYVASPMQVNIDWWDKTTALLEDPGQYPRLVGKLPYVTINGTNRCSH